jgi:hypothetical protein
VIVRYLEIWRETWKKEIEMGVIERERERERERRRGCLLAQLHHSLIEDGQHHHHHKKRKKRKKGNYKKSPLN